jgi:hypothetical protein
MLVRSFFVRRLVPQDQATFNQAPEAYQGAWQTNPEGDIGEVVSEHLVPTPVPDGQGGQTIRTVPLLGVLWAEQKNPAIVYEDPTYLECVDDEVSNAEEEEEEGEEE